MKGFKVLSWQCSYEEFVFVSIDFIASVVIVFGLLMRFIGLEWIVQSRHSLRFVVYAILFLSYGST